MRKVRADPIMVPLMTSRVVLLGASNVTRAVSTVVETARRTVGGPVEVLAALGHGRSYGSRSRVCGRTLPGIVDCDLWRDALRRDGAPTFALITDIGNDVMYGAAPETIAGWVETCVTRLLGVDARVVITALPIESIRRLGPRSYRVVKALLFPRHDISYPQAIERAERVHELVLDLAARHGVTLEHPDPAWYGFDPIHIRMRFWPEAWGRTLLPWRPEAARPVRVRASFRRWLTLRTATPSRWWLFGIPRGRPQPCRRLPDGTTVGLF